MAHGGYDKRKVGARQPANNRRSKGLGVDKNNSKPKLASLKNQIRSTERMLRKDIPPEVRESQEKKLEGLKKQQEVHNRLALEKKLFLRNRKIKFFERRKIERRLRRLEKQQRAASDQAQEADIAEQLLKLKEDLEYVKFFPKTDKYVSLFMGGDDVDIVDKRNSLRKKIKDNIIAAAASGKDLEETGSEDDGLLDPSEEDDFFLAGSSSDEADADDELTDKSTKEQASGKAASGMSSDERNQRQVSARALMPPPGPSKKPNLTNVKSNIRGSSSKKPYSRRGEISSSSNTSNSMSESSYGNRRSFVSNTGNRTNPSSSMNKGSSSRNRGAFVSNPGYRSNPSSSTSRPAFANRVAFESQTGNSSNLSSNSDARKPKRKRRPKKKKQ